jgi:sugar phosphate isomerase/epimerase
MPLASLSNWAFAQSPARAFKLSLNPGAIGVQLNQEQLLDAAIEYGFEAIVPFPWDLENNSQSANKAFLDKMQANNIHWDAANLPLDFRRDQATFEQGMADLKKYAPMFADLGVKACSTWIMPTHASLTYLENFNLHSERLSEVAAVLGEHDMQLGLEYVGPKTLMAAQKHPFISSMQETRELIAQTKRDNIGIQLDSYHWYCAEETVDDLLSLNPKEIITCDLNDAVAGRTRDQQIDQERELPTASGVIDLKAFLGALVAINYAGAVRAEPFNAVLNDMENDQAMALTKEKLDASVALL